MVARRTARVTPAVVLSYGGGAMDQCPKGGCEGNRGLFLFSIWPDVKFPRLVLPCVFSFMKLRIRPLLFRALLPFTALVAVHPARAADTDRYSGSDWALIDSKKALAAAADITAAKYPDSDESTVEEKMVQVYRPDGTGENQDEAYMKVLTEKGKRDRRSIELPFILPYFKVEVVKLEVIKPSGEVVPVDVAANSTETIDNSQMDENIYDPNDKVLEVNIPSLDIGDVVHSIVHFTTLRAIMSGEFSDENEFEGDGYIRHMVYEVHAPLSKPLVKTIIKDEVPGTVKYTTYPGGNDTLVHHWEITNVPRMFDEPSMPPYENVLQRILVSTTPDWRDVSKWYWGLSKSHLEATSPELKKAVADLTAGSRTDLDKAKALFYFVSQKIRYMGLTPEKDRPGFEPHDVCMTFDKQYGVCRDKAALLVAMLRAAGLEAYPVLVNVGSKKDPESPDPGFNHAIAAVELTKGNYTLLDPTDEHARDLQPWYDGNQSYLVARPDGDVLRTSSFKSPEENLMRVMTTGSLSADGSLDAKSELSFDGANDDVYRNEFSGMKPDDQRRYFEQFLKQAIPGARLKSLTLSPANMLDVSKPIRAEIEFTVDGMTATGHGTSVVTLPWIGDHVGLVNRILDGAGLEKRKYPMQTRVACGLDEEISLKLGKGFGTLQSTPVFPAVDDHSMSYQQTFSEKDGTLDCSRKLNLKQVEIAPDEYAALKGTLRELGYDARKSPVLAVANQPAGAPALAIDPPVTPPVGSNAIVLYSHKELDVTDAHSSVYRVKFAKRILTYAGKIGDAEIKVEYNPACEDAKIVRGDVISKTGERQEISSPEINVMDAKWDASAKRYTGGKVLVANLPGVDIGSTIEVEFEITRKNMPFIAGFEPFQLPDALEEKTFQLTAPANLKVEKMVTGASVKAGSPATDNGKQVFQWSTGKNPAIAAETELPPDWVYMPGISYFVGDYKAYLKELNDTLNDRSRSSTNAALVARHLASQSASKLDTLKAIRDFVAKSTLLSGPKFTELPLSELSAADTTLRDGYGHAADRAILLHAMLAAAGFQPEFVLASDIPPVDGIQDKARTFPLPDSYDTPLVKVSVDGATYYLNDTDQYAQLGSTAHEDRLAINLSSEASEVVKAAKDCQDRIETDYTLSFGGDGKLHMGVSKHYFGNEYNEKSRFFSELRPEERKRYYQEEVSAIDQGARPVGDLNEQFNTYPGIEQFSVDLDNYAVVDGKFLYFDLPFTPSLVKLPGGDQRSLPFMLSHEGESTVRAEIELPPGFSDILIAPGIESLDAPSGGGTARVTSSSAPGKFVLTDDFDTTPAVISPSDYPAMVKLESALEKKSAKVFLLQKD